MASAEDASLLLQVPALCHDVPALRSGHHDIRYPGGKPASSHGVARTMSGAFPVSECATRPTKGRSRFGRKRNRDGSSGYARMPCRRAPSPNRRSPSCWASRFESRTAACRNHRKPGRRETRCAGNMCDLPRPSNQIEALKGRRKGQWSIRINDQWRICFEWPEGSPGPVKVEIVDYPR